VCCVLCAVCCVLFAVCCLLQFALCMLYAVCCMILWLLFPRSHSLPLPLLVRPHSNPMHPPLFHDSHPTLYIQLLQSLGARAAPLLPYVTAHMTPHMTSLLRLFPRRLSRRHSAGEADFMDISFSARADKKKRALVPHINMRSGWSYQLRAKRVPRRGRKCVRVPVGRVDIATGDIATGDIATGETLDGPPFCAPASLAPKRLYRAASAPVLVTTPRRPCPLPLPLQTQPLPLPLPRRAAPYSALVRRKEQDRTPLQRRYDPPIRINLPAYNAGTAARTVAVRTAVP